MASRNLGVVTHSALESLPATGAEHATNLDEPAAFNEAVMEFFIAVERGNWQRPDVIATGQTRNFAAAVMRAPIGRRQYRPPSRAHQMQIATWERIPSRTQARVGVTKELGACRRD